MLGMVSSDHPSERSSDAGSLDRPVRYFTNWTLVLYCWAS